MQYKVRNALIPIPGSHRHPLLSTLGMYDKGEDLTNSPLIQSKVNLGRLDVTMAIKAGASEEHALYDRQSAFLSLYEDIKAKGLNNTTVWCWFDDDGYIHLYDGYHRLAILEHLGIDLELMVETEWTGGLNGCHKGRDFPLADVLYKEHPVGKWLYQPVFDKRVSGWNIARNDSPQRLDHILGNLVGNTVLDVGCSEGYFSREIAKRGYKVTAIDTQKGYISANRYLSILEGVCVDCHCVSDWADFVKDHGPYDNILFLCVIHNDMKKIGVEAGLKKLEVFRDKAQRIFLETPQEKGERQWNVPGYPEFHFQREEPIKNVEEALAMTATEMWAVKAGMRPIFTYDSDGVYALPKPHTVLVEGVNGYSMHVLRDEPIITPWIRKTKAWEPALTEWLKQNLKEGQVFVDIGANVGYYTLLASRLVGPLGRVYAFEPARDSFSVLMQNIELNKCNNVTPVNKAVSTTSGLKRLYNYGSSSDAGRRGLTKVEERDAAWLSRNAQAKELGVSGWAIVTTCRLEDYIIDPDVIKVDVEGGEQDVLESMSPALKKGKAVLILEDENDQNVDWVKEKFGLPFSENVKETTCGLQHFVFNHSSSEKPWWALEKWLPDWRDQYWPLFNTLRTKPCRHIMEIGTHNGRNAVVMIKSASSKVPEEEIHYYGFDVFEEKTKQLEEQEYTPVASVVMEDVKAFIEENTKAKVMLFKGNTRATLQEVVPSLSKMDLIYIDGGHSIETTRNDWMYAQKLMHKDTIVFFDDYNDEMPFIGSHFIPGELPAKYSYVVFPETNYYKRPFGRLKCQLLKVTLKKEYPKGLTDRFRFHLISLPHSKTIKNWGPCAFTQLTYRFSQMMHDMGHEVYHYGTEGSDPACTEHIDVLTEDVQKQAYGDWSPWKQLWVHNGKDLAYTTFRKNAIKELRMRKEPGDFLLISNGNWLKEISDMAGSGMAVVEPYVGYLGFYAKYKVFPSYAWMHHMYGKSSRHSNSENFVTGNWYDAVIQHFFDPNDFMYEEKKDDYFLYLGRLIKRKGVHIAVDLCKRIGARLVIGGQPLYPEPKEKYEWSLDTVGARQPHVEYVGVLNFDEMNKWRSKAKAVIVPSLYMEPFGLVVVEALLSGTPVITTDWGAFPEIVKQGEVGYRCRTMDDFIWAANNIHKIDPKACREYAVKNFSMERIGKAYQEYFVKVHDLFGRGWYAEHPERTELDWLKRY